MLLLIALYIHLINIIPSCFHFKIPPIDVGSEEGKKLKTLTPTVEFKNIAFAYPTRQDVQVGDCLLCMLVT